MNWIVLSVPGIFIFALSVYFLLSGAEELRNDADSNDAKIRISAALFFALLTNTWWVGGLILITRYG